MKRTALFLAFLILLAGCGEKVDRPANADAEVQKLNNQTLKWGLKKNKNAPPDINPGEDELLKKYDSFYIGDSSKKDIYLTFDEGYENGYTGQILDVLKKQNVPACFFVTGPYLKTEGDLIKRMVDEGHEVGNHTVNHPSMPDVKDLDQLENEMLDLDRTFYGMTGKTMKFMRPPMGEHSERTLAVTKSLGYTSVFWSIAYMDWDVKEQKGTQFVLDSVLNHLHNGAIILMHAVSQDNANALESVITEARNQGYTFQPLSNLATPAAQE